MSSPVWDGGAARNVPPSPWDDESDIYYDEETLFKVLRALCRSGLTLPHAISTIQQLQRDGILFRERRTTPP